jgi:curved DNA-binding protein
MNYKDYYMVLGVGKTATMEEIKKAYRVLANKYHPDKTNGDKAAEEKFKDIIESNEVLSDPVKRKKYNQFGADWKQYEAAGAQPSGFDWSKYASDRGGQTHTMSQEEFSAMFNEEDAGDLFEMLFGQHSGGQRQRKRSVVVKGEVPFCMKHTTRESPSQKAQKFMMAVPSRLELRLINVNLIYTKHATIIPKS